jgi:transposase
MASLLLEIKDSVQAYKDSGETCMPKEECKSWLSRYHSIIDEGYFEDDQKSPSVISKKTGKKINSKARQLLNRMDTYDIEHLAFMFDFDIPFDNNLSERDLRMQKLRQKISGSFRGVNGAKVFCRIRSYISTARKNGIRAFDAIQRAFSGNAFIPKLE